MGEPWRIRLLGGLRAARGEVEVTRFRSQQAALLLAYLAVHPRRSHPREELAELLWPEAVPAASRHSLRVALSSQRRQLELPGVDPGSVLVADGGALRLNPTSASTDVAAFDYRLRQAVQAGAHAGAHSVGSGGGSERLRWLREALACYRGPFLPGFYEDWGLAERRRLEAAHHAALEQAVRQLLAAGEPTGALALARRALHSDPTSGNSATG